EAPRNWVDRVTPTCALLSALLLALLALRDNLLETPSQLFWAVFTLPALGSVAGTWILWRRRRARKEGKPVPMAPWARWAWILASQAGVFLAGFYLGMDSDAQNPLEIMPSALAGLPDDKLDPQVRGDQEKLKAI